MVELTLNRPTKENDFDGLDQRHLNSSISKSKKPISDKELSALVNHQRLLCDEFIANFEVSLAEAEKTISRSISTSIEHLNTKEFTLAVSNNHGRIMKITEIANNVINSLDTRFSNFKNSIWMATFTNIGIFILYLLLHLSKLVGG